MKSIKKIHKIILLFILSAVLLSCNDKTKSEVMLKLFNMNTSSQLTINIPKNIEKQLVIDELVEIDTMSYAKGTKINEKTGEKITIVFDYNNITTINQVENSIHHFIAPFTISRSSSVENLKYIGLFELNKKTYNISHMNSIFLGDRIIIEKLDYDGNDTLKVVLKAHGKEQYFSEIPKVNKELKFSIVDIINKNK